MSPDGKIYVNTYEYPWFREQKEREKQEHSIAEKKISPSDIRKQAQELIRAGKMPTTGQFAKMMGEAREEYVPILKKLREKDKEK